MARCAEAGTSSLEVAERRKAVGDGQGKFGNENREKTRRGETGRVGRRMARRARLVVRRAKERENTR